MTIDLMDAALRIARALRSEGEPFLLMGKFALEAQDFPTGTVDLDFAVAVEPGKLPHLMADVASTASFKVFPTGGTFGLFGCTAQWSDGEVRLDLISPNAFSPGLFEYLMREATTVRVGDIDVKAIRIELYFLIAGVLLTRPELTADQKLRIRVKARELWRNFRSAMDEPGLVRHLAAFGVEGQLENLTK